jgi:hypothetical protein
VAARHRPPPGLDPQVLDRHLNADETAERRIALRACREQAETRMSRPSLTRTLVNPGPRAVRLVLSDGSERIVGPWGLAVVPRAAEDGQPVEVLEAFVLERRTIPGYDEADATA